jgi:cell division protease FtsH
MGPQKKSLLITDKDKKITAYHESGHAILGKKLEHCEEVQEVSIIPRGMAAGYTMSRPDTDDSHLTYGKLNDEIAMIMGGRIAEEIFMDDISTGASNDIQQATKLARKMVTEYGMSEKLGFINLASDGEVFIGKDYQQTLTYSQETAKIIDEEIGKILDSNYKKAKRTYLRRI